MVRSKKTAFFRTRLCSYFASDRGCAKGENCDFAHFREDLHSTPTSRARDVKRLKAMSHVADEHAGDYGEYAGDHSQQLLLSGQYLPGLSEGFIRMVTDPYVDESVVSSFDPYMDQSACTETSGHVFLVPEAEMESRLFSSEANHGSNGDDPGLWYLELENEHNWEQSCDRGASDNLLEANLAKPSSEILLHSDDYAILRLSV